MFYKEYSIFHLTLYNISIPKPISKLFLYMQLKSGSHWNWWVSNTDFERFISTTTKVTQWSFYIPFTANDSADSGLSSDLNNWNGIQPVLTASESFFLSMPWTVWMQSSHGQQLAAPPHNAGSAWLLIQGCSKINCMWTPSGKAHACGECLNATLSRRKVQTPPLLWLCLTQWS